MQSQIEIVEMACRPNIDQECQVIQPFIILRLQSSVGNSFISIRNSKTLEPNHYVLCYILINAAEYNYNLQEQNNSYISVFPIKVSIFAIFHIYFLFSLWRGRGPLGGAGGAFLGPRATGWEPLW